MRITQLLADYVGTIRVSSSNPVGISSNRREGRKLRKYRRRVGAVCLEVSYMLANCHSDFLKTLSRDEEQALKDAISLASTQNIDYYPIPKPLNDKMRRYIHDSQIVSESDETLKHFYGINFLV